MSDFKVGDKVRIKGGQDIWTVKETTRNNDTILKVSLKNVTVYLNVGVFELVERPKKLVKKIFERWLNVYPEGITGGVYSAREYADSEATLNRIACVKLTGEAEVPEDYE